MNRVTKSRIRQWVMCFTSLKHCAQIHIYFVELNFWHDTDGEHSNDVRPTGRLVGGFYYFFDPKSHSVINKQLIFCCSWDQILAETRKHKCGASNINILWFIKWNGWWEQTFIFFSPTSSVVQSSICSHTFLKWVLFTDLSTAIVGYVEGGIFEG